ncbi:MAG: hypothetical protein K9N49_07450 [Candidatus Marinimicrobia bacterium]|nr:hypothetical protein [Candidatus Neomarinimicrobiota bacterium]
MKTANSWLKGAACGLAAGLVLAGSVSAQTLVGPVNRTVVAGNTVSLRVDNLPTDPALAEYPTTLRYYSEDTTRVQVPDLRQQELIIDAGGNYYTNHTYSVPIAGVKRVDGLFDPIRVDLMATMETGGIGIYWDAYVLVSVLDPTLTYTPSAPAVQVGGVVPLVIRRTIEANANLAFTVTSANPDILGLATGPEGPFDSGALSLSFAQFELTRTVYLAGKSLSQSQAATNIWLSAQVGSYAANVEVLVTPNSGLALTPTAPQCEAGDSFQMTVTRGGALTAPLTVQVNSLDPNVVGAPTSVVIPQGAASATFQLTGLRPGSSVISVAAPGMPPGPDSAVTFTVANPNLEFVPAPITAIVGSQRSVRIRRAPTAAGADLTLTLSSFAPTVFGLETSTVTLPAGHTEASFLVTGRAIGSGQIEARLGDYLLREFVLVSQAADLDDLDGDGVSNEDELLLGSDPGDSDSLWKAAGGDPLDPDRLNDGEFDSDGDGLSNYLELYVLQTNPLRADTDGDGIPDGEEVFSDLTNPLHPMSNRDYFERSLDLSGVPAAGLALYDSARFHVRTNGWTVEAWVRPQTDGYGTIFALEAPAGGNSFAVELDNFRPVARVQAGPREIYAGGTNALPGQGSIQQLPTDRWTHVAAVWSPIRNSLEIYLDGVLLIAQYNFVEADFVAGDAVLARDFDDGYLDELRVWRHDRTWTEVDYWKLRLFPAPAGYVEPPDGQTHPLAAYFRFDENAPDLVDYARLNQAEYYLNVPPAAVSGDRAVALLDYDDEDGDLLPEWWVSLNNHEQYSDFNQETVFTRTFYPDDHPLYPNMAIEEQFNTFIAFSSIGNVYNHLTEDFLFAPVSRRVPHPGLNSAYLKYVYLTEVPTTALLEVFTPGMVSTIVYVNGQRLTPADDAGNREQKLNPVELLRRGRNMIYIQCRSLYAKFKDWERITPGTGVWVEGGTGLTFCGDCFYPSALGKFDARLSADGKPLILQGDRNRWDPRSVWHGWSWSAHWDEIRGVTGMQDAAQRVPPGNLDFGIPWDADDDSLNAFYELLVATNPWDADSDNDGIPDGLEDFDGDGLVNRDEQARGAHPLLPDSDDDGVADGLDAVGDNDPASALSPLLARSLVLGGSAQDYVEFAMAQRFALDSWTVEGYVQRADTEADGGVLIQRRVGPNGINYELGLGDGTPGTAPVNVPYVRFISTEGVTVRAAGAAPAPTAWTHLAGVYDNDRRLLSLYMNGSVVTTAVDVLVSPAIYAGGPVEQRIGAGLEGSVDEVRLWSVARTAEEITAYFEQTISGATPGLAAYYRFDDDTSFDAAAPRGTSANNLATGGATSQPWDWGQVQDYVARYRQDYWENWHNSATLRGVTAFSADGQGALRNPPSLQVKILPPEVVTAGAQWTLDGLGSWYNSGQTITDGLEEGEVTVLFRDVIGWTGPGEMTVVLSNDFKTVIEADYLRNGRLRVRLRPTEAVTAGAQWRLDGGDWQPSDVVLTNVSVGAHTLDYEPLGGWIAPPTENVTMTADEDVSLFRDYVRETGTVRVHIEPAEAVNLGARWRVDGGDWRTSGSSATNLMLASHLIEFEPLPPWLLPEPINIQLTNATLQVYTGRYIRATGLEVTLVPPEAVAAGAQWRLPGGAWLNSGAFVDLTPGIYTAQFRTVAGWIVTPNAPAQIQDQQTTALTGRYYRIVIYNNPTGLLEGFNKPAGLAFDAQRNLYVADSASHRILVRNGLTGAWSTIGGPGQGAGQFNQPLAVAVDAAGNLYVADSHNHRVQRRAAATGEWTVWGGPTVGTEPGEFNGPFDVLVAPDGDVYVADHYNNRVQRRDAATGQWSAWLLAGHTYSTVRAPAGLRLDGTDMLVSDARPDDPLVRRFSAQTQNLGILGAADAERGGLVRPVHLATHGAKIYVADQGGHAVKEYDPANEAWHTVLDGTELNAPWGVAVDDRGYLYISDRGNNRLIELIPPEVPVVQIAHPTVQLGGGYQNLSWLAQAGWFYRVEYTEQLGEPWLPVPGAEAIMGSNQWVTVTDPGWNGSTRFYRLVVY